MIDKLIFQELTDAEAANLTGGNLVDGATGTVTYNAPTPGNDEATLTLTFPGHPPITTEFEQEGPDDETTVPPAVGP